MKINPPIIVGPPDETMIFESQREAEAYLEPWFFDQYDPPIFDSLARRIRAVDEGTLRFELVQPPQSDPDALRRILVEFLLDMGEGEEKLSGLNTEQLLERATPLARR